MSTLTAHGRMGGDLGGLGAVLPKFEVGDGPCIRPSNISWSSVIGCVWKYELSKKSCHEGIFCSGIEVFRKKAICVIYYKISDSKKRQKRNTVDIGHQKFSALKWKFFPKEGHSKMFLPPPKLGAKSPPVYGRWENEMAMERSDNPLSYAKIKKMKSLARHVHVLTVVSIIESLNASLFVVINLFVSNPQ